MLIESRISSCSFFRQYSWMVMENSVLLFFFFLPSAKIVQSRTFMVWDSAGCQMQFLPFSVWLDIFNNQYGFKIFFLTCNFFCLPAVVGDGDIHASYWVVNLQLQRIKLVMVVGEKDFLGKTSLSLSDCNMNHFFQCIR